MAPSIYSSSLRLTPSIYSSSLRLTPLISSISTFKSPISGRMMSSTTTTVRFKSPISGLIMSSTTTVSGPSSPSPCLMLPPTLEGGGDMVYNFYNLAQNKVINFNNNKKPGKVTKIVGSSHGWLALYDEINGDLFLTNPVTRRHVKLPPSKGVSKVIISCDPEQDECQAMMIFDLWRLAFCRPGRSPIEWTPIGALMRPPPYSSNRRCYEDLVYSCRHKLFLCVTMFDNGDDLEGWDVAADHPRLRWENRDDLLGHENYHDWLERAGELLEANTGLWCEPFRYLVFAEQADQLFLVTRHLVRQMAPDGSAVEVLGDYSYPYKTVAFDVHKIDWELEGQGGRLIHVDGGSLDGLAMFVGLNHSFAVSATEANGLKPNSIYFTDEKELTPECDDDDSKYGGHDIGIFDYENKTISPCYYPCDLQSYKKIMPPPIWFTPTHH